MVRLWKVLLQQLNSKGRKVRKGAAGLGTGIHACNGGQGREEGREKTIKTAGSKLRQAGVKAKGAIPSAAKFQPLACHLRVETHQVISACPYRLLEVILSPPTLASPRVETIDHL